MANARAEREKPSGSGAGCVTFLAIFIPVASVVFGNRDAVLGAMGMGTTAIGPDDGEKNYLVVAVEKKATGTQDASFRLRRWGAADRPFLLFVTSLVLAFVLERLLVAFLKWGFSDTKPD